MDVFSYALGKKAGGGGTPATLIDKNISANGIYNASSDNADGYSSVNVNVETDYDWSQLGYDNMPKSIEWYCNIAKEMYDDWDWSSSQFYIEFDEMYYIIPNVGNPNLQSIELNGNNFIQYSTFTNIELDNLYGIYSNCIGLREVTLQNNNPVYSISNLFYGCKNLIRADLSGITNIVEEDQFDMTEPFYNCSKLAVLDISGLTLNDDLFSEPPYYSIFSGLGEGCLVEDGAYDEGIPYIYVKDEEAQDWVINQANEEGLSWSTDNVVIKQS